MNEKNYLKKFWNFLREDSWASLVIVLIIAFIVIKFFFFPILTFLTGSPLPLVIVESCSMHHYDSGFEKIFETSDVYRNNNITLEETENWVFQNGFNKGDVIFVVGAEKIKAGDVIIFNGGARYPLIHRVVSADEEYATKGDNYKTNPTQLSVEKEISKDQILGKALFRIPHIGWAKLIFFEFRKSPNERGLCG